MSPSKERPVLELENVAALRDELADREAIRDCIYIAARGLDRCDPKLLRAAYWPDADIDLELFGGSLDQFVEKSIRSLEQNYESVMHSVSNILIRLGGAVAGAESHVYGYHCYTGDGGRRDAIICGRYLDRFERRNGEWRIAARTVIVDWYRIYPDSADWREGPLGMPVERGVRGAQDISYALLDLERGPDAQVPTND
jgi:hypothetical protein